MSRWVVVCGGYWLLMRNQTSRRSVYLGSRAVGHDVGNSFRRNTEGGRKSKFRSLLFLAPAMEQQQSSQISAGGWVAPVESRPGGE